MKLLNQYLNYLILFLVIGYIGFYFYSKNTGSNIQAKQMVVAPKPNVDQVVNKYMQETALKNKLLQATTQTAIKNELVKVKNFKKLQVLEEQQVPAEQQIWKENINPDLKAQSPSEEINHKILNQEIKKAEEEAYKQEYARQYIENARKNGYHIMLDENMNVIKATPIRKPSEEDSVDSFPTD